MRKNILLVFVLSILLCSKVTAQIIDPGLEYIDLEKLEYDRYFKFPKSDTVFKFHSVGDTLYFTGNYYLKKSRMTWISLNSKGMILEEGRFRRERRFLWRRICSPNNKLGHKRIKSYRKIKTWTYYNKEGEVKDVIDHH